MQIKLLNKGLVIPAMEVQNTMMELVSKFGSYENIPEESISAIVEYDNMARNGKCYIHYFFTTFGIIIVYLFLDSLNNNVSTQNTETLRNQVVNQMLKEITARKICMYCKKHINKIQPLKNKIILVSRQIHKYVLLLIYYTMHDNSEIVSLSLYFFV